MWGKYSHQRVLNHDITASPASDLRKQKCLIKISLDFERERGREENMWAQWWRSFRQIDLSLLIYSEKLFTNAYDSIVFSLIINYRHSCLFDRTKVYCCTETAEIIAKGRSPDWERDSTQLQRSQLFVFILRKLLFYTVKWDFLSDMWPHVFPLASKWDGLRNRTHYHNQWGILFSCLCWDSPSHVVYWGSGFCLLPSPECCL